MNHPKDKPKLHNGMRVLACDPGYERLGIAVIERKNNSEALLYSDCIQTPKESVFSARLLLLGDACEKVLTEYRPDAFALEKLFFNINQKTAMSVAEVRGLLLYLAEKHGLQIFEYSPQEIKIATTGYGNSSKKQVADMVGRLLQTEKRVRFDDEFDAIAVGLTCLSHERF